MIIHIGEDGLEQLCKLSSLIAEKFTISVKESRRYLHNKPFFTKMEG